jgi:hypothetical protein
MSEEKQIWSEKETLAYQQWKKRHLIYLALGYLIMLVGDFLLTHVVLGAVVYSFYGLAGLILVFVIGQRRFKENTEYRKRMVEYYIDNNPERIWESRILLAASGLVVAIDLLAVATFILKDSF